VQALHSTGDAPPRLITWSADRTLGVWTSESGELRRDGVLRGHLDEVLCCDTGRFAASGSADGTVRLWDLNSFNEVARLEGQGSVTAVRISPPGYEGLMVVVFGSQNGSVGFWEVGWTERSDGTYEVLPGRVQTMTGHTMGVLDCQADFDRNLALSASLDHTLRLWDSLTGTELRKFEGHQAAVLKCGFLKDNVAISTSADSTVRTWDLGSGQPLATMNEHSAPVRGCIAVGNDQVVSCSDDRSMMLWTTPPHGPQQKGQARTRRQAPVRIDGMHRPARICFTDRSKSQFLTASSHRGFEVYDLKDDHHFRKIDGLVRGAVSSERLRMAFVWTDRAAYVWQFDMTVGGNIQEIPRELAQGIRAASFIHGRRLAVAYAHTHEIAVMDTFGPVLTTLGGHQEAVTALASDDEGRLLVSVSRDRSFRVWNGETLQGTAVFGGYPRALEGCVLAPDGSRLVSYIADRTLHTSERSGDSFTPGPVLRGHRDAITCAAMTPYNETIVSGSRDGTIRVWDAKSGREIQVLEGHRDWITALSISADGDTLLTSAEDDTLKLWDIASGRCLETFVGTCPFVSISIADRAVCAGDQAGRVWMLEWGEVKKTQLTSSSKIVLLTTMRDRPMAREVVASLKNFRGLGGQTEPLVLDLDDARESLTQAGEVGEADLVLVLATEAAAAHQNAPALDLAFRRASGGQLVVPLLEKPENWGNSELMRFQGVPWKSDDAHRNEKLTAHLQVHVAGVSL
jgi:WD40 repeat protein